MATHRRFRQDPPLPSPPFLPFRAAFSRDIIFTVQPKYQTIRRGLTSGSASYPGIVPGYPVSCLCLPETTAIMPGGTCLFSSEPCDAFMDPRATVGCLLVAVLLVYLPPPLLAQQTGSCTVGTATTQLDINNVSARLNTNGSLFRGDQHGYRVPKSGNASALFGFWPWLGGRTAAGDILFSGNTYNPDEYWPGPIDAATGLPPNPTDCSAFDRIWTITRTDLEAFDANGTATDDLATWPYDLGAPVVDGDGNPNNYDLAAGDRPYLMGDQMAWWVMNDAGNTKYLGQRAPIGLETQVTAYAFDADSTDPLANTTFYRYRFINKGGHDLSDTYIGLWSDPDLGDASDDYVGADTLRNMGFVYNGTEFDHGVDGYGSRPPALGFVVLDGPPAPPNDGYDNDRDGTIDEPGERLGMERFIEHYKGISPGGDPTLTTGEEPYGYLQGRWRDGSPITFGGMGFSGDTPARYMFPGDPLTKAYWSMENLDGSGERLVVADRRLLISVGPFDFAQGDTADVHFAIVWSQSTSRLFSVDELRRDVDYLFQNVPLPAKQRQPATPTLVSPPHEAMAVYTPAHLVWSQPENNRTDVQYVVQVSRDSTRFSGFDDLVQGRTVTTFDDNRFFGNGPFFWRVRAITRDSVSAWSQTWQFTLADQNPHEEDNFTAFEVTANAQGPLTVPVSSAAGFNGFPAANPNETQQVGSGRWIIHQGHETGEAVDFASFVPAVTGGGEVGNFPGDAIVPYDFEIRFTDAGGLAYDPYLTGCLFEVPFELWRTGIGTPNDSSDDVRLVPYVRDVDMTAVLGTDGLPAFNLLTDRSVAAAAGQNGLPLLVADHGSSGQVNDPQTDWITFATPDDETPGQNGYQIWQAELEQRLGVGNCDPSNLLLNMRAMEEGLRDLALYGWNSGDTCNDTDSDGACEVPAYEQLLPETGTTFRITTTKRTPTPLAAVFTEQTLPQPRSEATFGTVTPLLRSRQLTLTGEIGAVTGAVTGLTLREGRLGETGTVVADLTASLAGDGTFSTTLPVNPTVLFESRYFLHVTTDAHPDGAARAHFVFPDNQPPTPTTFTMPDPSEFFRLDGDANSALGLTWQGGADPDGNPVAYQWILATDAGFTNIIHASPLLSEPRYAIAQGTLDDALAAQNVELGAFHSLHQRVVTTDGLAIRTHAAPLRLQRVGLGTGSTTPETFVLHGNFPNPFNPTTRLLLDLPEEANLRIDLYDVVGRRIRTIVRDAVSAGAGRTIQVDATGLASGMYLYRIIVQGTTQRWQDTGRMVLVR